MFLEMWISKLRQCTTEAQQRAKVWTSWFHKIISKAILHYWRQLWIIDRKDQKQLQATQIRFLRNC